MNAAAAASASTPNPSMPERMLRTRLIAAPSPERVEIGRDVARFVLGETEVRHRGARLDLLRIAYPQHHVVRRIRQHSAEVRAARDAVERRPHLPGCLPDARNGVAASAPVALDQLA